MSPCESAGSAVQPGYWRCQTSVCWRGSANTSCPRSVGIGGSWRQDRPNTDMLFDTHRHGIHTHTHPQTHADTNPLDALKYCIYRLEVGIRQCLCLEDTIQLLCHEKSNESSVAIITQWIKQLNESCWTQSKAQSSEKVDPDWLTRKHVVPKKQNRNTHPGPISNK